MDMDVYPPNAGVHRDLPLVMILQGTGVDKSDYSCLAAAVQAAGYWVVVPNCIPPGRDYICPDETAVPRALASMEGVAGVVAASGVLLVGHSAGGAAAFESVGEWPSSPLGPRGIVVYGSNVPRSVTGKPNGPPVMLMGGVDDSIVTLEIVRHAFHRISWGPKALLEMPALDHFAIVDSGVGDRYQVGHHAGPDDRLDRLTQAITAFFGALTAGGADWSTELERRIPGVVIG